MGKLGSDLRDINNWSEWELSRVLSLLAPFRSFDESASSTRDGEEHLLLHEVIGNTNESDFIRLKQIIYSVLKLTRKGAVKEKDIVDLLVTGYNQSQIAKKLGVSKKTINDIVGNIRNRLIEAGFHPNMYKGGFFKT